MTGLARIIVLAGVSVVLPVAAAAAQGLPPAGARTLGLAGGGAASASGAEAVAVNPAAAALPGAARFSLTFSPVTAGWHVAPVTLSDLSSVAGSEIPRTTREAWIRRIASRGHLTGAANGAFTGLAAQVGAFGFQVSSEVHGSMSMNEDAAELLLFGNAGRFGVSRDMTLRGSLDAAATTTFGASWATRLDHLLPAPVGGGEGGLAVGALLTYSLGHLLLAGHDMGSRVGADPLEVDLAFPVVVTDSVGPRAGGGIGLTVGAAWTAGPWSGAIVIHDAVNTFRWRDRALSFRPGHALLNGDESGADFVSRPFSEAPDELRALVRSRTPSPRLALSGAWRASGDVELFADASRVLGRDMGGRSRHRLGFGAEYQGLARVPVRTGAQLVSGGMRLAGGMGLHLGSVEISAGTQYRTGSGRGDTTVGASATITPR